MRKLGKAGYIPENCVIDKPDMSNSIDNISFYDTNSQLQDKEYDLGENRRYDMPPSESESESESDNDNTNADNYVSTNTIVNKISENDNIDIDTI